MNELIEQLRGMQRAHAEASNWIFPSPRLLSLEEDMAGKLPEIIFALEQAEAELALLRRQHEDLKHELEVMSARNVDLEEDLAKSESELEELQRGKRFG